MGAQETPEVGHPFVTASGRPRTFQEAAGRMLLVVVPTMRRKPSLLHHCPAHALEEAERGLTCVVQTPSASARMRCSICGAGPASGDSEE